jgi:hypothetical protein
VAEDLKLKEQDSSDMTPFAQTPTYEEGESLLLFSTFTALPYKIRVALRISG